MFWVLLIIVFGIPICVTIGRIIVWIVKKVKSKRVIGIKSDEAVEKVFDEFGLTFNPSGGYHHGDELRILKCDDISFSDCVEGCVDGLDLCYFECETYIISDNNYTPDKLMFYGGVLQFPYERGFDGFLCLAARSASKFFSARNLFEKSDCFETESEEFNSYFKTYSDNLDDAFYILTPNFMEMLIDLEYEFKKCIIFILDNTVNIFLYEYDLFKINDNKLNSDVVREDLNKLIKIPSKFMGLKYKK